MNLEQLKHLNINLEYIQQILLSYYSNHSINSK